MMAIRYTLFPALFALLVCACKQQATTPQPAQHAPAPAAVAAAPAPEPMSDMQTLIDDHKVLIARVAGDLSKLPESLRSKVATEKSAYDAAFETYQKALEKRESLRVKLSPADWAPQSSTPAAEEFNAATAAAQNAREKYEEEARRFALVIDEVKKARGH